MFANWSGLVKRHDRRNQLLSVKSELQQTCCALIFCPEEIDQMILYESTGETATGYPAKPDYEIRATLDIKDQIPKNAPPTT